MSPPTTMLRQPSSRSHRSKKLLASHSFQAFLLVAVAVWIVYQLAHPFGERRRPVAVGETSGSSDDAEPARRRLGRKGFVRFPVHASVHDDDIAGARSWSDGSSDDPLSGEAGDGEGGGEGREADEDGGADGGVDDADDGLAVAADEEDDGVDFQSQDGRRVDDPKAVHGETRNGLNISLVATVNGTGTLLDGAAVLLPKATGGAADGTALTLTASAKNTSSSVGTALLRGTGSAGDVGNKLLANSSALGHLE